MLGSLVAGAALIVAGTLVALALTAGEDDTTSGAADGGGPASGSLDVELPLDLGLLAFADATVTAVPADEGPTAAGFCDQAPATAGLLAWSGDQLTEDTGRRRVIQLLARFRSSVDADAYVSSTEAIAGCRSWEVDGTDGAVAFTVAATRPAATYADDTRQFDLEARTDGPDLFLRVVVVRSGRDVLQLTYVSANRQDLDELDDLVATAVEAGGL